MKLGSGICPVPDLLAAGVNVALGTDGMCSNDGNDMYGTIKTAALLHKLWEIDYERWLGADAAWAMATANGPPPPATGTASAGSNRVAAPTSCCSTSTRSRSPR